MKSYPCETLSRQPPFSYQTEGSYGKQLVWRLVATVLLAAITALAWLSLIGSEPGPNEQTAARAEPTKQSISAATLANTKYDGRQYKWISTA
jgi:hypothetical protein